jgi:hypothetical protein
VRKSEKVYFENRMAMLHERIDSLCNVQESINHAMKNLCKLLGVECEIITESFLRNINSVKVNDISKTGLLERLIKLTKADEYELIEERPEPEIKLVKKSK